MSDVRLTIRKPYGNRQMNTLKEIIEQRQALNAMNEQRQKEYGAWCETFKQESKQLAEHEALLAGGVDLERLNHGQHVIYIHGDYRKVGGESAGCIPDAKADLVAGAPRLKRQYFGTKDYDRFRGQRTDCEYGMGPRHGHIVFEIGLTRAAREMELTAEMIEDALYVLANIDKVIDARKVAA